MAEPEEVVVPTAEEPETPETPETPEVPETPTPAPDSEAEKHRKAFEDQKKRAEKAEAEAKRLREKYEPANPAAPSEPANSDRMDRVELIALGVKDREEQDFVLSVAKRAGLSPAEAFADEFVMARIEKMRVAKRTQEATPEPNRGTGGQRRSKLPDFSKMTDKQFEEWERDNG